MTYEEVCIAESILRVAGYVYIIKRCELGYQWTLDVRRTPNVWPYSRDEPTRRFYRLIEVRLFLGDRIRPVS